MTDEIKLPVKAKADANTLQQASPRPATIEVDQEGGGGNPGSCGLQRKNNKHDSPHWTRYVEAGCAFILVLITGTYTYYASQQAAAEITAANAAQGANAIATTALETTNRAYVLAKMDDRHGDDFTKNTTPALWFWVDNQGHTPAFNLTHGNNAAICRYPLDPTNPFPDPQIAPTSGKASLYYGAPSEFPIRVHLLPSDIPFLAATNGPARLCVYGRVEYDTFNRHHFTRFCYVLGGNRKDFAEHCPTNNDSD